MNRLFDLRKNMLDMDPDELREHVRNIRKERRIVKDKPATKAKKVRASAKSKDKVSSALSKMSAAEIEALMKELGEDGSEGNTSEEDQDQG